MAVSKLNYSFNGECWESEPIECIGGDIRVRVHKKGPFPVDVMVSIDGEEEYLFQDHFGLDECKSEITIEGVIPGQFIKLCSHSEFTLIKYLEM
ncbi:MAG: hypothetical protein IJY64_04005 [Bacteroidaceae bacterium]|nr:hypothetical protein [Bacteroidaceae bacterium]